MKLKIIRILTDHLQVPLSTSHRVRVHLTHVPSPIFFVHVSNMQIPRSVIVVGKRYPWILGNNVVVNWQNRLSIYPDPGDLRENKKKDWIEDKMFRIFNRVQFESIIVLHVHIINSSMFQSPRSQWLLNHIVTFNSII